MNQADRDFLRAMGLKISSEAAGCISWRAFCRNGSVLMILPDGPEDFREGLSLYQPQRKLARLVVRALRQFPVLRKSLQQVWLKVETSKAVSCIIDDTDSSLTGVLLGNPKQKERRALLLLQDKGGEKRVAKLGVTPAGNNKIVREATLLNSLRDHEIGQSGIPGLGRQWSEEDWSAFTVDFFGGEKGAPFSKSEVVSILEKWASKNQNADFLKSVSWRDVSGHLSDTEMGIAGNLKLRSSLRHGDFAPWNILRDEEGVPVVIDWEFGLENDVPGWDLVHYLILEADLVERKTPQEALEGTIEALKGVDRIRQFLEFVGWAGHEHLLVKSYLLSMGDQMPQFASLVQSSRLLSN